MKTIFLGTPPAAVPVLLRLVGNADVSTVVTRPDRPRGRSRRPMPSAVKIAADELGIGVFQPETSADLQAGLGDRSPFDVGVVVAFGMLIRPETLALPRHGFVNVHFSVLPRWRGAAPVQRAMLARDTRTGVTLMEMDEGLDTGPVLSTASTAIGPHEDAGALTERLAVLGGVLIERWLPAIVTGRVASTPQDQREAVTAPKLASHERWVDLSSEPATFLAAVRALSPWPGAWVRHDGGPLRIVLAEIGSIRLAPGELTVDDGGLHLGVGDGSVRLLEVQPAGKRGMNAMDWLRGLRNGPGAVS
ncbi:MAG TPA: methionyl-tRNA formyltransferase [Acidimicrobiia bacterium]|nr:methionyl-tRNA formyltransferase [Acidimicrobiia bacterium]